jgi:hypothetical protein
LTEPGYEDTAGEGVGVGVGFGMLKCRIMNGLMWSGIKQKEES